MTERAPAALTQLLAAAVTLHKTASPVRPQQRLPPLLKYLLCRPFFHAVIIDSSVREGSILPQRSKNGDC